VHVGEPLMYLRGVLTGVPVEVGGAGGEQKLEVRHSDVA
jgi:hypothetical protein